jgi:hypothetical protein
MQNTASAGDIYQKSIEAITNIQNNKDMSSAAKQTAINNIISQRDIGLGFTSKLNGLPDVSDWLSAAGPEPVTGGGDSGSGGGGSSAPAPTSAPTQAPKSYQDLKLEVKALETERKAEIKGAETQRKEAVKAAEQVVKDLKKSNATPAQITAAKATVKTVAADTAKTVAQVKATTSAAVNTAKAAVQAAPKK